MKTSKRLRRNMARVEFFACMETVESMLRQGFSRQLIYERLKEEGRISMAYVTFCKLIAKAAQNDLRVTTLRPTSNLISPPAPKPPAPRPSQPNLIKERPDALQDPRTIDPTTVF